MMPLFDMLTQAQNGEATRMMARQFGLSEAQVEQAMAALMPAFSTGLRRNAQNPHDVGNFLQALASGRHAQYFDDTAKAFTPQGMAEGNGILGHVFGSKEVSRAVAAQAAATTGIGEAIIKQMLPILAPMIMGGLFKQSTGQMPGAGGGSGNVVGDILAEMMKGGTAGAARQGFPGGANNPFGQVLEGMFGGGGMFGSQPSARQEAAPSSDRQNGGPDPFADNPLGQIFRDMMAGGRSTPEARHEPEPETETPSVRPRNPYDEMFGQMFDAGREVQRGYQKDMESIFDQFLSGMNKQR